MDRDVQMLREGITMHPMVELIGEGPGDCQSEIDAAKRADIVLYALWGDSRTENCDQSCPELYRRKLVPASKLALLDFSDGTMTLPWAEHPPPHIYFKRSLVRKVDGSFSELAAGCGSLMDQHCFPLDYAVRPQDYAGLNAANIAEDRTLSIVFLFPDYNIEDDIFFRAVASARQRVKHWFLKMKREKTLPETAEIGFREIASKYFRKADIVVVVDPAGYEGQHSIYEALGNGALVILNNRWVQMPYPCEGEKHVHYFNLCDTDAAREAFEKKVQSILSQSVEERAAFRLQAWRHPLEHHQATNRIDYIVQAMLDPRQPLVIPENLRLHLTEGESSHLKSECMRRKHKWLETRPYLLGGRPEDIELYH